MGGQDGSIFNQETILVFFKCKDDQNGLIHPENSRLKFVIIGGVRSNFLADFFAGKQRRRESKQPYSIGSIGS